MRVLILHNRYRAQGGEERAVQDSAAALGRAGHEVRLLERSSAAIAPARAAAALLRGGEDPAEIGRLVREERIDVVHAHNVHPLFGWRALAAAREAGARTVLQLHNFRLFCAIGVAYRDDRPCHDCRGANTLPGLVHRCRGSLGEAAVYAGGLARQQRSLLAHADRIIVLSEGHGALLRAHGLAWDRVSVVPNFIAREGWASASSADRGAYALVAGRLVREKGLDTAIRAAAGAGVPLVVAGTGPDEARLRSLAVGSDVRFAGWVDGPELGRVRSGAAMLLAPSRCEEACPYSVLEGLAAGLPVLVSDRGGLPELVAQTGGVALDPDSPRDWETAVGRLWVDPGARLSAGEAALTAGRERFGEERYLEQLLAVYGCEP
jgi:glycosyltransferase involved in cell wall biosynthesis